MNYDPEVIARSPELRDPVIEYVKDTAIISDKDIIFIKRLTKVEDEINEKDRALLSDSYRKILFHHLQGIKKIVKNDHDETDNFNLQKLFSHLYGHAANFAFYLYKQTGRVSLLKKAYRLRRSAHRIASSAASLGATMPEDYEYGCDANEYYDDVVLKEAIAMLKGEHECNEWPIPSDDAEWKRSKPVYPGEEYMLEMLNYSYTMLRNAARYASELASIDTKNKQRWLVAACENYELYLVNLDSGRYRLNLAQRPDAGSYLQQLRGVLAEAYGRIHPGMIAKDKYRLFQSYTDLFYHFKNDPQKQAEVAFYSASVLLNISNRVDDYDVSQKIDIYSNGARMLRAWTNGLHFDPKDAFEVNRFWEDKPFYESKTYEFAKTAYDLGSTRILPLLAEAAKKTMCYEGSERAKEAYEYFSKLAEQKDRFRFQNLLDAGKMAESVYESTENPEWLRKSLNAFSEATVHRDEISPGAFRYANYNKHRLNKLLDNALKNRG